MLRVGIFGSDSDPQCLAVARELKGLSAQPVIVDYGALEQGQPLSWEERGVVYRGEWLGDVRAWYLRFIPAPYAPYLERDDELVLFEDWFERYMHSRERASFYVAWLLQLVHDGALLLNPPQAASVLQYKPFQLHALRKLGAPVPRSLLSNDPARIRAFHAEVGQTIYKPLMGGATTELLDAAALSRLEQVTASPVIFQERIQGEDLRVMLVGDQIVSCVSIHTGEQCLDFRNDPVYSSGQADYREVTLPPKIQALCRSAARACGLGFAGIDLKKHGDQFVFLELNSSPIYLDVELKLGHPISAAIAKRLVEAARLA